MIEGILWFSYSFVLSNLILRNVQLVNFTTFLENCFHAYHTFVLGLGAHLHNYENQPQKFASFAHMKTPQENIVCSCCQVMEI